MLQMELHVCTDRTVVVLAAVDCESNRQKKIDFVVGMNLPTTLNVLCHQQLERSLFYQITPAGTLSQSRRWNDDSYEWDTTSQ